MVVNKETTLLMQYSQFLKKHNPKVLKALKFYHFLVDP